MRHICVLTGTRAEFGLLEPVINEIKKRKTLKLSIIATGQHLKYRFGYTLSDILKGGFKVDKKADIISKEKDTSALGITQSIGLGILKIGKLLHRINPDILVVLGDRIEALAGTIASAYQNIPVAHIEGGVISTGASIDNSARHAITKFAHLHFVSTNRSAQVVTQLGEERWRIFMVGSTAVDNICRFLKEEMPSYNPLNKKILLRELPNITKILKKYRLNLDNQIIILLYHGVSSESPQNIRDQINKTITTILRIPYTQIIAIYPNYDIYTQEIISTLNKYKDCLRIYKSIPHKDFLFLLSLADVLVGNSSCGFYEAPSFGLPVVNIGNRQEGREDADNIIHTDSTPENILKSINRALFDVDFKLKAASAKNPYGDGNATTKIVDIIENISITEKLIRKSINIYAWYNNRSI